MPKIVRRKSKIDKREGIKRKSYNIPDEVDIKLLQNKLQGLMKKLNLDGSPAKGITEAKIKQLIRNAVREEWMKCDTKLAFIASSKVPDTDPNTRRRFKLQCNCCKQWFSESEIEVDHIVGEHSFTNLLGDLVAWINAILNVKFSDLQILCVECHKIKTRAEGAGVSTEEAIIMLKVDEVCRGAGCPEKKWLEERGITPLTNKELRKNQVRDFIKNSEHNNE